MKCKFCEGEGQIVILAYKQLSTSKVIKTKLGETGRIADCPECNGSGKEEQVV